MLNMIVGTYLCSAVLVGGFEDNAENWTFLNKDLVVAALWGTLILVTKIIDGIIDIPLSSFTDNLHTRFGRRRPAIAIGFIPMIIAYVLFLFPLTDGVSVANTVWFAVMLGIFYCTYTLTMLTYYATFAEIVDNDKDRVFLSNVKSICDVVYFSLSFALVPLFVSLGINIKYVALIFLPLSLTMLIPFFLIKEPSSKIEKGGAEKAIQEASTEVKGVDFVTALKTSLVNKDFLFWLFVISVMNLGLQLFLSGINEFFSSSGLNMTFVMASSFAPVPFTLQLYNKVVKKRGVKFGLQYILIVFAAAMLGMYFCSFMPKDMILYGAIVCGIIASFSIGAFFSVSYTIPSQLAAEENSRTGICVSSMYFAVQGLFEGIAAGLASGVILVFLKQKDLISYMTIIIASTCILAFILAFFLPKSIALLGKEKK